MRRPREFNKTPFCFLEDLNQHNADRLTEMMTEDHVFIDSLGHVVHGGEWLAYAAKPAYKHCCKLNADE
jgi:hypothetical protein